MVPVLFKYVHATNPFVVTALPVSTLSPACDPTTTADVPLLYTLSRRYGAAQVRLNPTNFSQTNVTNATSSYYLQM